MKIVVILPTYNEKVNIEKMIPVLEEDVFPKIKNHHMHLLVADDQSPDGTAAVVREYQKKYTNLYLLEGNKEGLGAAYARAMKYAMNELEAYAVIEFDSDFQHDPQDIPRLIKAMDEGADYVIGSRYIPGGQIPKEWGWHRKFISQFGGRFAQIVLWHWDIHDLTSGFKLSKSEFLKKIDLDHLFSKYYAYKLHILHDMLLLKVKVKEVPILFYERKEGSSKITQKDLFDSFWVVMKLRIRDSKRFIKFLIVGGTGFILQLFTVWFTFHLGVEQFVAAMIGGEIAILSNFFINNAWTFGDTKDIKEQGSFLKRLVKFNVASLGAIVIQGIVVYIAVALFGSHLFLFGQAIPTSLVILVPTIFFLVIPLNYFVYNKIIWKTHYLKKAKEA
jgi:dolichol-phosphate mannosyltransferase